MIKKYFTNLKIGIQGEKGCYSEIALSKCLENNNIKYFKTLEDVFNALKRQSVDYAFVPIENSYAGSINKTYDLLMKYDVFIVLSCIMKIKHVLLGTGKLSEVKYVYSHPHALLQCERFLNKMNLKPVPVYDTAGAVRIIKEKKLKTSAAIASEESAKIYKLKILKKNIQDLKENYTKFILIGNNFEIIKHKGVFFTSIIFCLKHKPGALYSALKPFALEKINLTKLESRPDKKNPWNYIFYLDFEGSLEEKNIKITLEKLNKLCIFLKYLGSYPLINI